jgi:hypothetical protein
MDPRDGSPPFANGVDCGACGRVVPHDRIRVLASRDDLTFVELDCPDCRSESLGIVVVGDGPSGSLPYGEFLAADDERFRDALPIDTDDLVAVRQLLATGRLDALIGRSGDQRGGGSPA